MKFLTLPALALLAACATPQQIVDASRAECAALGYKPGTVEHTQCAERGYRNTTAAQQQAAAQAADAVLTYAILDSIF